MFLCDTYTNNIAVVKEVDLGFKLILYKYCFIIVKSILFQIWNIIRQYFLTPPNKNPISSPNPHSLSGWGCVELVQQLQYKTKVCFISWRSTDSFTISTSPTHYHLELRRKLKKWFKKFINLCTPTPWLTLLLLLEKNAVKQNLF